MNVTSLTSDLVSNPGLWRLSLLSEPDALTVVACSRVDETSLIHARLPFDPSIPSTAKALEEIVYANPLLLADFGQVDVVARTIRNTVLPAEAAKAAEAAGRLLWPDEETVISTPLPPGETLVSAIDTGAARFIARTFNNPAVTPHLSVLHRYFAHKSRLGGNSGKMYVHLRQRDFDVVAFSASKPTVVNTYRCENNDDALYYIIAAAKLAGFDFDRDEMLLCGDAARRAALTAGLRRFAACVMPLIFPSSMFGPGAEAMNAPFELIVLPLCE